LIIPQNKKEAIAILNKVEDDMNDIFHGTLLSSKNVAKFIESFDSMRVSFGIQREGLIGGSHETTNDNSGIVQEVNT